MKPLEKSALIEAAVTSLVTVIGISAPEPMYALFVQSDDERVTDVTLKIRSVVSFAVLGIVAQSVTVDELHFRKVE